MAGSDSDPLNTLPTSSASFLSSLQTFLREEDAERLQEQSSAFVVSGGLHSTRSGLTSPVFTTVAYVGGFRIAPSETTITYTASQTTWVIAHVDESENIGAFTRVTSTHYLTATASTIPTLPANSVFLMRVTTSGDSITAVVDLRKPRSYAKGGFYDSMDPLYGAVGNGTTDDTSALQACINGMVDGARLLITSRHLLASPLVVRNGIIIDGGTDNPTSGYNNVELYTSTDTTLLRLTGGGSLRNLLLRGAGDYTAGTLTGTGIELANTAPSLHNVFFSNLRRGIYVPTLAAQGACVSCRWSNVLHGISAAASAIFNNFHVFGSNFTDFDYALYNPGTLTGESRLITFSGCHFEAGRRAAYGQFGMLSFNDSWFERLSSTGIPRSDGDSAPFQPLINSNEWFGENNIFTSTANGNLSVAGSNILIGGYFSGSGSYNKFNYGLSLGAISETQRNVTKTGSGTITNESLTTPTLTRPLLDLLSVTVNAPNNPQPVARAAVLNVSSSTAGATISSINDRADGAIVTITNSSANDITLVNEDVAFNAADRLSFSGSGTLIANYSAATFVYHVGRWRMISRTP